MTSRGRFLVRLALSLALIAGLLIYVIDPGEMLRILKDFDPTYLAFALLVVTLDRVLMTYKWTVLLKAQGYRLPLFPGIAIYCASMVWGMALPATVGADAIRAAMTVRRGVGGAETVASIVIERMVGFVLALALSLVSLMILRALDVLGPAFDIALWLGAAGLLGALALLLASLSPALVDGLWGRLPRALRESKPMSYLQRFAAAYQSLGASRGAIAKFSGLTVIEQLVAIVFPYTLALGLDVPADLLLLLGVLPISTLISRLPISFDGLGVYESVFVGLLVLAGISAEAAFAIAISGRFVQLAAFLPWWLANTIASGAFSPPRVTLHRG